MRADDFTILISCGQCGSTKCDIEKSEDFGHDFKVRCHSCGNTENFMFEIK